MASSVVTAGVQCAPAAPQSAPVTLYTTLLLTLPRYTLPKTKRLSRTSPANFASSDGGSDNTRRRGGFEMVIGEGR